MVSHSPPVKERIRELRKRRGWSQKELGAALMVTQAQVSLWEQGTGCPSPHAYVKLASFALEEDRDYWFQLAGVKPLPADGREYSLIPLLRDPAAAGTPRAVDENEISRMIPLPREWMPQAGTLHAITIRGDSMEPVLYTGFIVIIDVDQRDAHKLIDRMVVAREGDGLTVKWLRRSGDLMLLVPENLNQRNPVQVIGPGSDITIVGRVVKWIGEPNEPPEEKKRK